MHRFTRWSSTSVRQTVVVGAGPAGLVTAMALARHGHRVTIVDRDAGPGGGGPWQRRGVSQFHQPHVFRSLARLLLARHLPDVLEAVVQAGAVPVTPAGGPREATLLRCRRETFERTLRVCAMDEPNVSVVAGHADALIREGDRVTGVVVDGRPLRVGHDGLVVDATGRRGHLADDARPRLLGGDCGFAYASRLYRLRPVSDPGPENAPPGWTQLGDGYVLIIFPHDAGTFSVLLVRDSRDRALAALRHVPVWDAAMAGLDAARAWTDPRRAVPLAPPRAGAGLTNHYQGQAQGLRGLLFAGDSVCTTNPVAGRGASLAIAQACALVEVVAGHDSAEWAERLEDWGQQELRPWYDDAVVLDAATHRRWDGEPVDPEGPVTSDLVLAAAQADPSLMPALGPYLAMLATPDSLAVTHPQVRQMLRAGWRPAPDPGPTRDELVAGIRDSVGVAVLGEEVPQQRRRLVGEDAADHLGPVVEPAVAHHVPQ